MISSQLLYHRIDCFKPCTNISGIQMIILFRFCGSLFIGHCRSDQLVEHYNEFATDMGWDSSCLLHLGIDAPNVNLKFQKDLKHISKNPTIKNFLTLTRVPSTRFIHSLKREFSNCQSISITSLSICTVFSKWLVPDVKIIIT